MRDHGHPRLHAYLDGELDAAEAVRVAHHLGACAQCRDDVEAAHRLDDLLAAPTAPLPPRLLHATCRAARAAHEPRSPLWWLALPYGVRLAIPALVIVAAAAGLRLGARLTPEIAPAERLLASLDSPEVAALRALGESAAPERREVRR